MQFEYDPERLIEEVRKRPAIWDYEDPEYRAKNLRHIVWSDVVNELIAPDVKVSKGERRELVMQLQKKWKSIRDCYQKYITNPNRTRKPYIYIKQLQFLQKNQDNASKGQDDNASSSSEENPKKVWKTKKKFKITKEVSSEEETNNYDNYENSRDYYSEAESVRPAKIAKINKSHDKLAVPDEFVFANVETQLKVDSEDADKMFLLSLLPHLKTIPEEHRLNVKVELMQVLRNANFSTVREHKII